MSEEKKDVVKEEIEKEDKNKNVLDLQRAAKRRQKKEFEKYKVDNEEDLKKVKDAMEQAKLKAVQEAQQRKQTELLKTPWSKLSSADRFNRIQVETNMFRSEMMNKYLQEKQKLDTFKKFLYQLSSVVGDIGDKTNYMVETLKEKKYIEVEKFEDEMEARRYKRLGVHRKKEEAIETADLVWACYAGKMIDDGMSDPNLILAKEECLEKPAVDVGSGSHIPEFDAALMGMKEGEKKTAQVKFPDDYDPTNTGRAHKFAGRVAEFHIEILKVKYTEKTKRDRIIEQKKKEALEKVKEAEKELKEKQETAKKVEPVKTIEENKDGAK